MAYKRIAVYYDGTRSSERALDECARLAKQSAAQVMVIAVALPRLDPHDIDDRAITSLSLARRRAAVDRARRKLTALGVHAESDVLQGIKAEEIGKAVDAFHADALVIGERSRLGRALFGSLLPDLKRRVSVPVVAVK